MKGLSRQEKKLESQKKSSQQLQQQTLKKELTAIETKIKHLEVQKHALLESMANASTGQQDALAKQKDAAMELAKSGKALKEVEENLSELEEKWLEISHSLEDLLKLPSP